MADYYVPPELSESKARRRKKQYGTRDVEGNFNRIAQEEAARTANYTQDDYNAVRSNYEASRQAPAAGGSDGGTAAPAADFDRTPYQGITPVTAEQARILAGMRERYQRANNAYADSIMSGRAGELNQMDPAQRSAEDNAFLQTAIAAAERARSAEGVVNRDYLEERSPYGEGTIGPRRDREGNITRTANDQIMDYTIRQSYEADRGGMGGMNSRNILLRGNGQPGAQSSRAPMGTLVGNPADRATPTPLGTVPVDESGNPIRNAGDMQTLEGGVAPDVAPDGRPIVYVGPDEPEGFWGGTHYKRRNPATVLNVPANMTPPPQGATPQAQPHVQPQPGMRPLDMALLQMIAGNQQRTAPTPSFGQPGIYIGQRGAGMSGMGGSGFGPGGISARYLRPGATGGQMDQGSFVGGFTPVMGSPMGGGGSAPVQDNGLVPRDVLAFMAQREATERAMAEAQTTREFTRGENELNRQLTRDQWEAEMRRRDREREQRREDAESDPMVRQTAVSEINTEIDNTFGKIDLFAMWGDNGSAVDREAFRQYTTVAPAIQAKIMESSMRPSEKKLALTRLANAIEKGASSGTWEMLSRLDPAIYLPGPKRDAYRALSQARDQVMAIVAQIRAQADALGD